MPEEVHKADAGSNAYEHTDKEKRPREIDSPERERPQESVKRRELSPLNNDNDNDNDQNRTNPPASPSRKSTSTSGNSIAPATDSSSSNHQVDKPSVKHVETSIDSSQSTGGDKSAASREKSTAPLESRVSTKPATLGSGFGGFSQNSGFSSAFANSGGFSSLLSAQAENRSTFSSLLDTTPKTSIFEQASSDFGKANARRPIANDNEDEEDADENNIEGTDEVDEEQYIAVKGLEKTVVPTGEEGETCIHSVRAKLYAINPKSPDDGWKERGVGNLRLLQDTTSRTRLVMRADAVLRVILNMPLRQFYKLEDGGESMGDKTIRLFGVEEGMGTWLAMRVGSKKAAEELHDAIAQALKDSGPTPKPDATAEAKSPAIIEVNGLEPVNNAEGTSRSAESMSTTTVEPVDSVEAKETENAKEIEEEKNDVEGVEET